MGKVKTSCMNIDHPIPSVGFLLHTWVTYIHKLRCLVFLRLNGLKDWSFSRSSSCATKIWTNLNRDPRSHPWSARCPRHVFQQDPDAFEPEAQVLGSEQSGATWVKGPEGLPFATQRAVTGTNNGSNGFSGEWFTESLEDNGGSQSRSHHNLYRDLPSRGAAVALRAAEQLIFQRRNSNSADVLRCIYIYIYISVVPRLLTSPSHGDRSCCHGHRENHFVGEDWPPWATCDVHFLQTPCYTTRGRTNNEIINESERPNTLMEFFLSSRFDHLKQ